jgi:glycosyltransferase involved in cell wall biosynthesis
MAAFACRPASTSETGVGWAVAAAAARSGHTVVLVTQPRHRAAIESARRDDDVLTANLLPVYLGLPATVMDQWDRMARLKGLQVYNLVWQGLLWGASRRRHRSAPFDLGHHVTLSTDWIPSGLAFVPELPLVWGPLGGGERVPASCRPFLGIRGRVTELLRTVTADPLRATLAAAAGRRCALLIAQNPQEAEVLARCGPPVTVRPNVFLEADASGGEDEGSTNSGLAERRDGHRAVFAGRLMAWKGVHLALAVLQQPEMAGWALDVYGRGPEYRALQRRIDRLGLGDRVVLHGHRPRAEVRRAMEVADVFFYPSMREAAGWVVAEALAVGCPVVCLDTGGPPVLLEGTGAAVTPGPDMVAALAAALTRSLTMPRTVVRWDQSDMATLLDDWYHVTERVAP